MANALATAVSQSPVTFNEVRIYLYTLFNNNRDMVIQLENSNDENCIPYYIRYIESKGINFLEALNYCHWECPKCSYSDLVKMSIVEAFRKLEKNDLDFLPF